MIFPCRAGPAPYCGAAVSVYVYFDVLAGNTFNGTVYVWGVSDDFPFEIGFLIDNLTATMMVIVTFVSLMVHIYTIGYMHEDPGYQRFFSYIALFTFSMLMLVMSNNFMQLFFEKLLRGGVYRANHGFIFNEIAQLGVRLISDRPFQLNGLAACSQQPTNLLWRLI